MQQTPIHMFMHPAKSTDNAQFACFGDWVYILGAILHISDT